MMKDRIGFIALSIFLSLAMLSIAAFGCNSAPRTKTAVKVVMGDYFAHYVLDYAINNGLVTSNSVDVTIVNAAGQTHNTELLAGNEPIGEMTISVFATANTADNVKFKAVDIFVDQSGLKGFKGVALAFTKTGGAITKPQDLVGKKVGVTDVKSNTTTVFLGMLKQLYNINESQLTLVAKPPALLNSLLTSGDVDAIVMGGDPSIQNYYSLDKLGFKLLWNLDQAFMDKYGTSAFPDVFVADAAYLKDNPDVVKAVVDVLRKSLSYGQDHLADLAQKYAAAHTDSGLDATFYQNVYNDHYHIVLSPIEGKYKDSIMAMFGFTQSRGIITALPDPVQVFSSIK